MCGRWVQLVGIAHGTGLAGFLNLVQAQQEVAPLCNGNVCHWPTRRVSVWELSISGKNEKYYFLTISLPSLAIFSFSVSLLYPFHFEDFCITIKLK